MGTGEDPEFVKSHVSTLGHFAGSLFHRTLGVPVTPEMGKVTVVVADAGREKLSVIEVTR